MQIIITIVSILLITVVIWLLNKFLSFSICPICAGVSVTWIWILTGLVLGFLSNDYNIILAMLMGGSIVGIAYQAEKTFSENRSKLLWKVIFIPLGFFGVYGVLMMWWFVVLIDVILLLSVAFVFKFSRTSVVPQVSLNKKSRRSSKTREEVEKLEAKMKDCC